MQPSDLSTYSELSSPDLSPDGVSTLFVVSKMNLEEDRYDRSIWLHDAHGERTFTAGPGDSSPKWSPDGDKFAFMRVVNDVAQIAVMSADGGEARVVTESDLGFTSLQWFDDGNRVLATESCWAPDWDGLDDDERARMPRRITQIPYRFDAMGWVHQRQSRLAVVDVSTSDVVVVSEEQFAIASPKLLPDQQTIVYLGDNTDRLVRDMDRAIYQISLGDTEATQVTDLGGWYVIALDGSDLLVGGYGGQNDWPRSQVMYRYANDEFSQLAPELDRTVAGGGAAGLAPQMTGAGLAVGLEDGGRMDLAFLSAEGHTTVVTRESVATGFSAAPDGQKIVFTASEMTNPGELYSWQDGVVAQLTSINVDHPVSFVEGTRMSVPGAGGDIDAWVYMPEGDGPFPVLLNVHGGPSAQYGSGFFDEFQLYVGAGYAVVACNPRGSSGHGTDWMQAVTGDGWGVNDLADIQSVMAAALHQFDQLDADNMGVMGGSYGGFMTGWITAREDRWKSAVVERALLSYPSFYGTSDIGTYFTPNFVDGSMNDDVELLWERSPLAYSKDIKTPTLIVHSENDWRCPIEQGEQLFAHLLMNGVETEFLRFPGEGHEMSRGGGKPKHRKERAEAIIEWHDRFLKG